MRSFLLLLALVGSLPALESPAKALEWARGREQVRTVRVAIEQGAAADRTDRAGRAAKIVAELIARGATMGVARTDADLRDLINGVRFLSPAAAAPLDAALAPLPAAAEAKPDAKTARAWSQLLDNRRLDLLKPTEVLFKKARDAGMPSIARDCVDQALVFWPAHRDLRRNLGQTLVDGRWYGPRETELTRQGLRWDDELGWIVADARERYAKDEYFDLADRRWTTLHEADSRHSQLAQRWVLTTEHLQIQGTAPLRALVDTANRLESFYDRVFAAYAGFFVTPGKRSADDLRLLFGTLDHPRLVINVADGIEGYRRSLPATVDPGWSDGMFMPSTRESYFYAGPAEIIYHEFTHQILHVFTGTNRSPAWLSEGAAVYTEAPQFSGTRMILGDITGNTHLGMFIRQEGDGVALTLESLLALEDGGVWLKSTTPELNYPAAGALVQFCMEAENRRYRADFIDFLRDSYRNETRGYRLWEYLGMDYRTFATRYGTWRADFTRREPVQATRHQE